jgi:hypothetical protein
MKRGLSVRLGIALTLGSATALADGMHARVLHSDGTMSEARPVYERPLGRDEDVPPGYHIEERPRKAPIYAGAAVLAGGYLMSALWAPMIDQGGYAVVPVLGPWLWLMADHPVRTEGDTPDAESLAPAVMVFGGLAQTAGIVLVLVGVGSTRKWVVRGEPDVAKLVVLPHVGSHGASLSLSGAF